MPVVACGSCGAKVKVPEAKMGGHDKCPSCSQELFPADAPRLHGLAAVMSHGTDQSEASADRAELLAVMARIEAALGHLAESVAPESKRQKEYKVVRVDSKLLTASVDSKQMEELLNQHARNGWTVKSMVEFDPPSFTGSARAFLIVLERDWS